MQVCEAKSVKIEGVTANKMGKRGRRTRWRTLTITDDNSDSEESNAPSYAEEEGGGGLGGGGTKRPPPRGPSSKSSYYNRFTYTSSQSTPIRRYQCDNNNKSTRSSSTASENKITFNEEEYTRITTPRQDVLFKKGYLNKPKTYQTQTSTGTSTTSASNSTGNGTPDHQSTDLEYESQFVFPNGFVDQNGIYYVNGFESYPIMVYNPPTYYQDMPDVKTKRYSTGSLTGESTSPNNEETTSSQDVSETTSNCVSDYNGHVYIYPGFYINGACPPPDEQASEAQKRRRRKASNASDASATTTETEEDAGEGVDEEEGKKYDLKPDAEEFVPRAIYPPEPAGVQFIKISPNFVPLPILPPQIAANYPTFVPQAIGIIPAPNFVAFDEPTAEPIAKDVNNQIDIAKIVSKLEEAAKEQRDEVVVDEKTVQEVKVEPVRKKKVWKQAVCIKSSESTGTVATPVCNGRNYSETVKAKTVVRPIVKKVAKSLEVERKVKIVEKITSDQWISVSNRKKRKNRNVEEVDEFEQVAPPSPKDDHLFESYDPTQLKDVVIETSQEIKSIIETTPESKPIIETSSIAKEASVENQNTIEFVPEIVETIEVPKVEEKPIEKKKTEPKSKKKTVKKATKRILIIDDLSQIEQVVVEPCKKSAPIDQIRVDVPKPVERSEKKSKKKKKKPKVEVEQQSAIGQPIDYDFLLESTLQTNDTEKTNVEISEELNKMIQRGIYSNLEEKIKSLNIETHQTDDFFKTIANFAPTTVKSRESSVEGADVGPKSNFDDFIKQSMRVKPTKAVQLEPMRANLQFGGDFFGDAAGTTRTGGNYPLTHAVREWMTKTRETTPDVEIFKSPSRIFEEFGELKRDVDEDEVTVYELSRETSPEMESVTVGKVGTCNGDIDEVEVYESCYGRNEDYLQIKSEIDEAVRRDFVPKHGNLPYRAICCSIM